MKYKSLLLSQASGSMGGITWSHNQGGLYTRARTIPTNPSTVLQQAIRNAMSSAHAAWRDLTDEVRLSWEDYAYNTPIQNTLGESIQISGLLMFLRQFILRAQAGVTQIITAPPTPGLTELSELSIAQHLAQDAFDLTYSATDAWCTTTGGFLAVFQSAPMHQVINFFKGPYQYQGKQPGNTGAPPASPFFFTSRSALVAGQRFFFRAIACDSEGRLSASQFLQHDQN